MTVVAVGCGGGRDGSGERADDQRPPLTDEAARAAIVEELAASLEHRSGRLRFAVRDGSISVTGVADHDRRRYVSRVELVGPGNRASYDVAVIDGQRYEKLLRLEQAGGRTPDFKPTWSSPEPWSPGQSGVPYVAVPYVGERHADIRRDVPGFDDARRRALLEAVVTRIVNLGPQRHRDTPVVRYRLTFDRAAAEAQLEEELFRGVLTIPPAAPPSEDVEVEIDHRGRLRRYVRTPAPGVRIEVELWDHGKPSPVEMPDDLDLAAGTPPVDPAEQRRAEQSLLTAADLSGFAAGSTTAVEPRTYAECWARDGVLDPRSRARTAGAEAPGFRRGSTYVGMAVALGRAPAEAISAYRELEGTSVLSCVAAMFQGVVEAETGLVVIGQSMELVREPPLADQSIAHRVEYSIGPIVSRVVESRRTFQLTVLRKGRSLALLFTVTTDDRFPENERQRLARLVASRLPA